MAIIGLGQAGSSSECYSHTGRGYTGVNGLNALLATICTPTSAPMIAATRLRKGATNSVRGAAKLLTDALATTRRARAVGLVIVRADSAFYSYDIINACRRAGACFSITPATTHRDRPSPPFRTRRGNRSATPTPSSTTSSAGSPTPRSPRSSSPAAARASTSPPRSSRAGGPPPQPDQGVGRPERDVRCLPLPRDLHR
jgi:hypothetical protein